MPFGWQAGQYAENWAPWPLAPGRAKRTVPRCVHGHAVGAAVKQTGRVKAKFVAIIKTKLTVPCQRAEQLQRALADGFVQRGSG